MYSRQTKSLGSRRGRRAPWQSNVLGQLSLATMLAGAWLTGRDVSGTLFLVLQLVAVMLLAGGAAALLSSGLLQPRHDRVDIALHAAVLLITPCIVAFSP